MAGFMRRLAARLVGKASADDGFSVGSDIIGDVRQWSRTNSGVAVNALTAMQHTVVMSCVSILAEDVAKIPLGIYRKGPNGEDELATDHWLSPVIQQPNSWQTQFEWIEMMMAALALRGNAYSVIVYNMRGVPEYFVPIHPDRIALYEAPGGEWFYSVSASGLHEIAVLRDTPMLVPSENMLHLKWLSQWSSLLGSSRISMMRESIGLSMSQEEQSGKFVGEGARMSGILSTEQKLTKEAAERIRESWQEKFHGRQNAGSVAVLEGGLKYESMTMTLADAEWLAGRNYQALDIARGFRMPPHKLGFENFSQGASMVQADQDYLNNVLAGYCQRIAARVDKTFGLAREGVFAKFDYSHFLKADLATRIAAYRVGIQGSIYTVNEARKAEGLPTVKDGDTVLQPGNMVPLGTLPTKPGAGGPGSDTTGAPAPGGDGDPLRDPLDPAAPAN